MSPWQQAAALSTQGLNQVFDNKAAYVQVKNFLSSADCQKLITALRTLGLQQYAWNIYLSDPGEGGECVVYNKPWEKADDQYIKGATYGYDHEVVKGAESIKIKPEPGMLLLFNSRNFHEVLKSTKPRLSLGGHVGRLTPSEYQLWV